MVVIFTMTTLEANIGHYLLEKVHVFVVPGLFCFQRNSSREINVQIGNAVLVWPTKSQSTSVNRWHMWICSVEQGAFAWIFMGGMDASCRERFERTIYRNLFLQRA